VRGTVLLIGVAPTPRSKCFLDMLGVFAEYETNLRRERQLEGIAKGCRGLQGPARHRRVSNRAPSARILTQPAPEPGSQLGRPPSPLHMMILPV
jgi:hypothetical protein